MIISNNVKIFGLPYGYTREQKCLAVVSTRILQGIINPIEGRIKLGLSARNIDIVPNQTSNANEIWLTKDLMDELNIFEGMEVSVKFDEYILSLGPVVGFITNSKTLKKILDGIPGPKILQTMKAAKQANVFLYFFTIYDILWAENSINAAVYNPSTDSWEKKKMPFPDVIYDRGLAEGLSKIKMKRALGIRDRLSYLKGLQKINAQHYFDKWDVYYRLSKYEDMKKYLPETVLSKGNIGDLKSMIDKYSNVYLKACISSNGRNVMRVRKVSKSSYEYDHFRSRLIRKDTNNIFDILEATEKYMKNREYIIQQGIDVLTYEGNKVDVRVLVQKDGSGKWQITNMPVRIAVDNCPVTSTKSGSNVYKFDNAFLNILKLDPKKVKTIKKNIYDLIYTAVDTIEEEYGSFGELGIDVAIDKNYGLWFLESNSKPAKDTIIKSGSEEDIESAFLPPFKYARYLSGFSNMDTTAENPSSHRYSMPL